MNSLPAKAVQTRDTGITVEDHIILLSTCSANSTNGRDILAGRIADEVYDDLTINLAASDGIEQTGPDK